MVLSLPVVYPFEGPLQVKNQYPIFLHADQPYLDKASMEDSLSASLSHSSTYTVQTSRNWVINLDMEITEFNMRYKRIIRDYLELEINLPVLIFSDGFMDGFLEDYHNTFGFPDYGRSERPLNEFLYEVRQNGDLIIKGSTGTGIGDIRLAIKRHLILSDRLILSLKGNIEFPTNDGKEGYSNGSIDTAFSLLLDKGISDSVMTYWNLGVVFPGDLRGYHKVDLKNFLYGAAAVEILLGRKFSLIAQLQGQSGIYPETELLAVDRAAYLLALGGRYITLAKHCIEFSLTEDVNASGAPDFIANLTYRIKL
jgi:hypothetical protein